MTSEPVADPAKQAECWCCGTTYPADELVRLGCHDEVGLCEGCVGWLADERRGRFVRRAVPILATSDLPRALAHYAALGFDTEEWEGGGYGFLVRDGVELHLGGREGLDPAHNPVSCYLFVRDADALHAEWDAAGVGGELVAPIDTDYGLREGRHVDPRGERRAVRLAARGLAPNRGWRRPAGRRRPRGCRPDRRRPVRRVFPDPVGVATITFEPDTTSMSASSCAGYRARPCAGGPRREGVEQRVGGRVGRDEVGEGHEGGYPGRVRHPSDPRRCRQRVPEGKGTPRSAPGAPAYMDEHTSPRVRRLGGRRGNRHNRPTRDARGGSPRLAAHARAPARRDRAAPRQRVRSCRGPSATRSSPTSRSSSPASRPPTTC